MGGRWSWGGGDGRDVRVGVGEGATSRSCNGGFGSSVMVCLVVWRW